MKAYTVIFDWSTEDDSDVEINLFSTYEKALSFYEELIEQEKVPELSWAGAAFNQDGTVDKRYSFSNEINADGTRRWYLIDKNNWNMHDIIDLKIMEVQ